MRQFNTRLAILLFLLSGHLCAQTPANSISNSAWPSSPEVAANAYLLIDLSSGQTLAQRDADKAVEPASLTKLMTAYVTFEALKAGQVRLNQTLAISQRAWKMSGSRMFVDPKMRVTVENLLKGLIVQSGNDAAVALAEGVAGSVEAFVSRMNQQAKILGMKNTGYKNPEGLTETGHTSTARDLAILTRRLITDHPQYFPYYSIKRFRLEGTPAANDSNRNLLLFRDPSVDGLKTGHTEAAGYCMIATARRAQATPSGIERRLISIVLGADSENSRAIESQKLLNWGFSNFETLSFFPPNRAVLEPRVWKASAAQVKLGTRNGIAVSVPVGTSKFLTSQVQRPEPLIAPFEKGQVVGRMQIKWAGQVINEIPLEALEEVSRAGVFGRAWDALQLWMK